MWRPFWSCNRNLRGEWGEGAAPPPKDAEQTNNQSKEIEEFKGTRDWEEGAAPPPRIAEQTNQQSKEMDEFKGNY